MQGAHSSDCNDDERVDDNIHHHSIQILAEFPMNDDTVVKGVDPLSMFKYDLFNTILRKIGLGSAKKYYPLKRIFFFLALTWVPILLLSLIQGVAMGPSKKESFLLDFAAYAQDVIAIPSMIFAEWFLNKIFLTTANYFKESGIVSTAETVRYNSLIRKANSAAAKKWPEIALFLLAFILSSSWILLETSDGISTWHAIVTLGRERITFAGIWVGFIAVPIYQFLLYRWIWKVGLWSWFLWKISRLQLTLSGLHPDRAAGLGFLAATQSAFGVLLFSVGSSIAGTVIYKIIVSEIPVNTFTVWGPLLGFVILGPLVFMLPLLSFTDKLFWVKEHAEYEFGVFSSKYIADFNRHWMDTKTAAENVLWKDFDIQSLAALSGNYDAIHSTKIVPFDLKSMLQLSASAFAPMLPLITSIFPQVSHLLNLIMGGGH
jgi:hypothetical protein